MSIPVTIFNSIISKCKKKKKRLFLEQATRCIAIKTNIFLFIFHPASVHEIRQASASEALPADFRGSSDGDIFYEHIVS